MDRNRKTWLIGDTHFNHIKMCEYCNRPKDFNERIVRHWRKMIAPDELVYHLGDVYLGKRSRFFDCIKDLPGTKVLIRGNHDREKPQWYLNHGFVSVVNLVVVPVRTVVKKRVETWNILLSHKPIEFQKRAWAVDANIHGHFHNNNLDECEEELSSVLTKNHYLFSLEETKYKPVLLERAIRDGWVIQGR